MVAIGRALISNPKVLLCDEISLGLAPVVIKDIYAAFPKIKASGASVIVVEQDIAQALKVADRVYCMMEGALRSAVTKRSDTRRHTRRLFRKDHKMIWIDSLIQGILLGGLYALFAAGLSLVFGIMRLVNLAHGDLIVFSAYITLAFVSLLGLHPFVAAFVAAPVMFGIGWLLQRLVLNRVLGPDILPPLLVTFGLSIVLQNALLETWSADSRRLSVGALETASLSLGPITVGVLPVMTFVTAILVIVVLNQISFKTELGRAFRATSDDPVTAQLMGIRPNSIFATPWGLPW